jgi:hypothetical protein
MIDVSENLVDRDDPYAGGEGGSEDGGSDEAAGDEGE